jgi:hypothetical protein
LGLKLKDLWLTITGLQGCFGIIQQFQFNPCAPQSNQVQVPRIHKATTSPKFNEADYCAFLVPQKSLLPDRYCWTRHYYYQSSQDRNAFSPSFTAMSNHNSTPAFQDFNKLSANIWYLKKEETSSASHAPSSEQPDLVIVSAWMGANPKHISKYVLGYRTIFPNAALLVITNAIPDVSYRSDSSQRKRLDPALSVVEGLPANDSRLLIHVFSNGGVNQVVQLASMYQSRHRRPLPVKSMILDSCPGTAGYKTGLAALSVGLPKSWALRAILLGFIHLIVLWSLVLNRLLPERNLVDSLRRRLNDSSLFPFKAPRVYIYSPMDLMVSWKDIESHAVEASKKGWPVHQEVFEKSSHVGHLMADKNRYWEIVKRMN